MKVRIKLGKVKKFGIGWCNPHRVMADNAGGGSHEPPLGVISPTGDAPTNPKFLDFSKFDPFFHLVKSFFIFFVTFTKKMPSKFFFAPKNNDFLTKMVKNIVFSQKLAFFVSTM